MSAVVLHSGGMDSSICLMLATQVFGKQSVVSFGFNYAQRHASELIAARKIADHFGVRRVEMDLPKILGWEKSSLVDTNLAITDEGKVPNSFVPGRNGLFLMMAAPFANSIGAKSIYIGVLEQEGANSSYPDCYRSYIDSVEKVIRMDLSCETFRIETPLVHMTKVETYSLADLSGELEFLLENTISCYEGISLSGCQVCPACLLRNGSLREYYSLRNKKPPSKEA